MNVLIAFAATEPLTIHLPVLDLSLTWRGWERIELEEGIWLTRGPQWLPASALDEMADADLPSNPETLWAAPRITGWPDWHVQAVCRGLESADSIFFGGEEDSDGPPLRPSFVAAAKALCAVCPVSRECLTWALEKRELFGIWGGQSGRQREKLRRRMRAGETIPEIVDSCLP